MTPEVYITPSDIGGGIGGHDTNSQSLDVGIFYVDLEADPMAHINHHRPLLICVLVLMIIIIHLGINGHPLSLPQDLRKEDEPLSVDKKILIHPPIWAGSVQKKVQCRPKMSGKIEGFA